MTNSIKITDLDQLMAAAVDDGILSPATKDLIDLNDTIALGSNGVDMDDILATDVTLLTLVIDDSGSISYAGLEDAVRQGQNEMLDAFLSSKQKDAIMMATWYLNSKSPLHSYATMDNVIRLDDHNYVANGGTPLYDRTFEAIASNVAYAQQLRDTGTPVTNVVVIITDGEDQSSRKYRAADCARLIKDVMQEQFTVVFVGVGSNTSAFEATATQMGIPKHNILTITASPSEIRRACRMISQSTIRTSQTKVTTGNAFFAP